MIREQQQHCTFEPDLHSTKMRKFDNVPPTLGGGSNEEFSLNLKRKLKEKQQRIAAERR